MRNDTNRRRTRRRVSRWRHAMRERRRAGARASLAVLALAVACLSAALAGTHGTARACADEDCTAIMLMPIDAGSVIAGFDGPEQPWDPGHRGVDVRAGEGDAIRAPVSGVVVFAGLVGGKSSVSLRWKSWTLTFEPARTALREGTRVERGQRFATVAGSSDHCDARCVHWGMRAEGRRYADPSRWLDDRRVRLVPAR